MCGEPQSALRNLHAAASYQTVHLRVILLWCSGEESGGLFKAKTRTVASRSINMGSKFKEQTSGKNITNKQMLPYGGMRWFDEHDSDKNGICFTESRSHLTGTPIGLGPTFGDHHPSINQSINHHKNSKIFLEEWCHPSNKGTTLYWRCFAQHLTVI